MTRLFMCYPFSRILFAVTLCTSLLSLAPLLRAVTPDDDPAPALVATINGVLDLTSGQTPEVISSRVSEIRTKMNESFAIDAIVQRAFGRNWSKFTIAQQKEVIDLLGRLIIRTYAAQIGSGDRPQISIASSKLISPGRREVTSTATSGGKTVVIVYRFATIDGRWKVYDVIAENVSVVSNYRQQFDVHFEKKNAEDLLKTLREKVSTPLDHVQAR